MLWNCRYSIHYTHSCYDPPKELVDLFDQLQKMGVMIDKDALYPPGLFHSGFFDAAEDGTNDECIHDIVRKIRQLDCIRNITQLYSPVYSSEELDRADYLSVRSTYFGLEPVNQCTESIHKYERKQNGTDQLKMTPEHCIQTAQPKINKKPKWRGTRQFSYSLGDGFALYCSDTAKEIIEGSGLTGASFRPVYSAKTDEPLDDVWELWPQECQDFFIPGEGVQCHVCKICGQRMYQVHISRHRILYLDKYKIPPNTDIFQSPPLVGASIGISLNIVSGRAYRLLKQKNIIHGLIFEPREVR